MLQSLHSNAHTYFVGSEQRDLSEPLGPGHGDKAWLGILTLSSERRSIPNYAHLIILTVLMRYRPPQKPRLSQPNEGRFQIAPIDIILTVNETQGTTSPKPLSQAPFVLTDWPIHLAF